MSINKNKFLGTFFTLLLLLLFSVKNVNAETNIAGNVLDAVPNDYAINVSSDYRDTYKQALQISLSSKYKNDNYTINVDSCDEENKTCVISSFSNGVTTNTKQINVSYLEENQADKTSVLTALNNIKEKYEFDAKSYSEKIIKNAFLGTELGFDIKTMWEDEIKKSINDSSISISSYNPSIDCECTKSLFEYTDFFTLEKNGIIYYASLENKSNDKQVYAFLDKIVFIASDTIDDEENYIEQTKQKIASITGISSSSITIVKSGEYYKISANGREGYFKIQKEKSSSSTPTIPDGNLKNGWVVENGNTYYYVNGVLSKGKTVIDGKEYYFDDNGVLHNNYVFLGDSLTDYYDLDKYFEGIPIINSGIAGNTTDDIINNIEYRVYQYNPTKLFLLIGTNDIQQGKSKEYIINNIEKIIKLIKEKYPNCKIYIQSLYPINNTDNNKIDMSYVSTRTNKFIMEINESLKKLANNYGLTYIDVYSSLIDKDGNLNIDYTVEGLHLNSNGYNVVTNILNKYINEVDSSSNIIDGWHYENGNFYYYNDGEMLKGFLEENGKLYYFGNVSGQLKYGCSYIGEDRYYSNNNGEVLIGHHVIDGYNYYFGTDGKMLRGFLKEEDKLYYYGNVSGQLKYGWSYIGEDRYYSNNNGEVLIGHHVIDGYNYYFGTDGKMLRGFLKEEDKLYYYGNVSGQLKYGWSYIGEDRYYSNNNGEVFLKHQIVDGYNYYFGTDGKMLRGFLKEEDKLYYYGNVSGQLKYGWSYIGEDRYYSNNNGEVFLKHQIVDGYNYYFGTDGKMLRGFLKEDDKIYYYGNVSGQLKYGWSYIGEDRYYSNSNGEVFLKHQIVDGYNYYFGTDGKMLRGFLKEEDKLYYYGNVSGQLKYGWSYIGEDRYYSNSDGEILTGKQIINNQTYVFADDGKFKSGFLYKDGNYYYYGSDFGLVFGWFSIGEDRYYSDEKGVVLVGHQIVAGSKYYFETNGKMFRGFLKEDEKLYYYGNVSGQLKYGWSYIGEDRYYSNSNGEVLIGHQIIDGYKYYFEANGKMYHEFLSENGKFYYYGYASGQLKYGWSSIDEKFYYSNSNGEVQFGDIYIDGDRRWYRFDSNGVLQNGWKNENGNTYYYDINNNMVIGIARIMGTKYLFNSNGVLVYSNIKQIIDVSYSQGYINWDTLWSSGEIDGVIIRAGSGSTSHSEDDWFQTNVRECERLGIPYGVYWYSYAEAYKDSNGIYTNTKEVTDEAQWIINLVNKYCRSNFTLGIYWDLESNGNIYTSEEYNIMINTFMNYMTNAGYGNITKIYCDKNHAENIFPNMKEYVAWVAHYTADDLNGNKPVEGNPSKITNYSGPWRMWQYTSNGYLPGVSGAIDKNIALY